MIKLEVPEKLRDCVEPRRSLPDFVDVPTEKAAKRELARIEKAWKTPHYWKGASPKEILQAGLAKTKVLRKESKEAHALLSAPSLEAIKAASIETLAVAERMAHHATRDSAIAIPIAIARGAADAVRVMARALGLDLDSKNYTHYVCVVESDKPSRFESDWAPLRHVVCAASEEDYARAVKVAAALRRRMSLLERSHLAYAFPDESWATDDLRTLFKEKPDHGELSYLLSATTISRSCVDFLALPDQSDEVVTHGMSFALVFPEKDVLPLLAAELPKLLVKPKYGPLLKGRPRAVVDAISLYKTKRAAEILAPYLGNAIVGPQVAAYFQEAPELRDALGGIARGKTKLADAAQLLLTSGHKAPRGPLANDADIPAVLRDRPWMPREHVVELVIRHLVVLTDGEERIDLRGKVPGRFEQTTTVRDMTDDELAKWRAEVKKDGYAHADFDSHYKKAGGVDYVRIPVDEGLVAWNEGHAYVHTTYAEFLARHGTAAIPGFARRDWAGWLAYQEGNEEPYMEVLAYIVSPRIAGVMARIAARRKNYRKPALAWMLEHPETAALGLIPNALGKLGEARDDAELSLLWMAQKGARDAITSVARRYGVEPEVDALLSRDPLAIDKKPPKLPDFFRGDDIPPVRLKSGARLPDGAVDALLEMMRVAQLNPPYAGIALVREACDEASLGALSRELVEKWVLAGHPGRFEWMLFSAAYFPWPETTARVAQLARDWARRDRKTALRTCAVLAAVGSDMSLLHLGHIAATSRFADLRDAARAMLDESAAARGLTRDELEDRIVPDVPVDAKDRESKAVVDRQLRRFEQAMVSGRTWSKSEFMERIIGHALLADLARRLVWDQGAYFRVTEDGAFADARDKQFALEERPIRVAHPARMSDEDRRMWASVFANYRVLQPFEQLGRLVEAPTEADRKSTRIARGTITVAATKALGTLESRGGDVTTGVTCVPTCAQSPAATPACRSTPASDGGRRRRERAEGRRRRPPPSVRRARPRGLRRDRPRLGGPPMTWSPRRAR